MDCPCSLIWPWTYSAPHHQAWSGASQFLWPVVTPALLLCPASFLDPRIPGLWLQSVFSDGTSLLLPFCTQRCLGPGHLSYWSTTPGSTVSCGAERTGCIKLSPLCPLPRGCAFLSQLLKSGHCLSHCVSPEPSDELAWAPLHRSCSRNSEWCNHRMGLCPPLPTVLKFQTLRPWCPLPVLFWMPVSSFPQAAWMGFLSVALSSSPWTHAFCMVYLLESGILPMCYGLNPPLPANS